MELYATQSLPENFTLQSLELKRSKLQSKMLSEEDTLFADDIKAEGLGLRVVKGLGVVLAVVGLGLGLGVNRLLFEFLMGRRVVVGRRVVEGRLVVVVVVVVVLFVVVLLGGGGLRVVVVVMGLLVGLGLATEVVFLAAT